MKKIFFVFCLFLPLLASAETSNVLINEIAWMGTTGSANDEWLELYNPTNQAVDLTGWRLEAEDGSPKINLNGTIEAGGYFLLERTDDDTVPEKTADQIFTGSFGNSGEWLKLYNQNNNLVDQINALGTWPGGDNDTKQTLERLDLNSWQTSFDAGGTPKAQNSSQTTIEEPEPETQSQAETPTVITGETSAQKGQITITEIFPNPQNNNFGQEFFELKNTSQTNIDLTDWKITNLAKQKFILPSLIMTPGCSVAFDRNQTNLALNNFNEKITLYSKDGKIIDQAGFKTAAPADQSYQKNSEGQWSWENISPGKENIFQIEIMPQVVIYGPKTANVGEIIFFDGSDSFDPQRRKINFLWNFGDGQTVNNATSSQTYLAAGSYEVTLNVFVNNQASSTETFKIKITDLENKAEQKTTTTPVLFETNLDSQPFYSIATTEEKLPIIFISEFLPSPAKEGNQQEFIEIFNQENYAVDLAGFQLDDAEKGSQPYTIPENTVIQPGQYLAFLKDQTKIALNNDSDSVRLLSPTGQVLDAVSYQSSQAGVSYVLDQDFTWQQTQTPTTGEINSLNKEAAAEDKTPTVLGAESETEKPKQNIYQNNASAPATMDNKTKYFIAAGLAAAVLVVAGLLKLKSDR
ncbi:MAG: lamin tail domain-containing protein [Candidatus Buchananbacteria bacterium]